MHEIENEIDSVDLLNYVIVIGVLIVTHTDD